MKQALTKVGNPNILVNIVSRRVRQLTTGGGAFSRPLIAGPETANLGAADIALLEIIEDKISFELLEKPEDDQAQPTKKRRRS
jgi:DNA-directed RNA polymerase subunit omega